MVFCRRGSPTSVSTAPQARPATSPADNPATPIERVAVDGKFLRLGTERYLIKGVTYGTFAPDADGYQFPPLAVVDEDFRLMAELGINTVRVYTPPRRELLDAALTHGLRVMVGLPWAQHIAFLDSRAEKNRIRQAIRDGVKINAGHPAVIAHLVGNEISPDIVRWHGPEKVRNFLEELYDIAKEIDPDGLVSYANYPSTEYLNLDFFDFLSFNVYQIGRAHV